MLARELEANQDYRLALTYYGSLDAGRVQCRSDRCVRAHSSALLAFGSDRSVELLSAVVVLMQFTPVVKISTELAARIAGVLLFILAGIVVITAITALILKVQADTSVLGMGVTIVALLIMPVRGPGQTKQRRNHGQSRVSCRRWAYLAALTLLGLILNAALHIQSNGWI